MSNKVLRLLRVLNVFPLVVACAVHVLGQDCAEPYANFKQSVISISFQKVRKGTGAVTTGSGTGFVITDDGHVVTAYHVIEADPDTDKVILKGAIGSLSNLPKRDLQIVAGDKARGIALLRFKDTGQPYNPLVVGDPFKVKVGNPLCSLSFSELLEVDYHSSVGILSARNGTDPQAGITSLWVTDMNSNHGESGAPVIDLIRGGVVAIKHGGRDPATTQRVNYLVPLNLGRTMLDEYCDVKIPPIAGTQTPEKGLESLKVHIRVAGADNDFTTMVGITVSRNGLRLASSLFEGLKFATNDVYGPYSLSLGQTAITKTMYRDSEITLSLRPNGHDTWITALSLEARFHDGEIIRSESGKISINQDSNTLRFRPEHLVSVIRKSNSSAVAKQTSIDSITKP